MSDQSNIVQLPPIPDDAPEWVRALPSNGRFVDRTKFYDITGHLIFDSLLNLNGIRHFFYFATTEKQIQRALRAVRNSASMPINEEENPKEEDNGEVLVAFHLGEGICGHKGIVHGGLTATMIDEVSSAAALCHVGHCFTANLNIDYVKPLLTPAWVLVRAHVDRQEGQKVYVHATVENGKGVVFAKSVGLFIKPKALVQEPSQSNHH